jgi:hypothetical protein
MRSLAERLLAAFVVMVFRTYSAFTPAPFGNINGVSLVAALNHAQVVAGHDSSK